MKKLELKNLKIKTLSEDGQANINGGRRPWSISNNSYCQSFTCLKEIPDAPGNPCKYSPITFIF